MWAWLKWLIVGVVVSAALSQFVRPSHSNPPVIQARSIHAQLTIGPEVDSVLSRSCNDCHSNQTVWPWYSNVAPISWIIASDVSRGRDALNFSEWDKYSAEEHQKLLKEVCIEASDREMPGIPYTWLHPDARLSDADIQSVCAWTNAQNK